MPLLSICIFIGLVHFEDKDFRIYHQLEEFIFKYDFYLLLFWLLHVTTFVIIVIIVFMVAITLFTLIFFYYCYLFLSNYYC